MYWVLNFIFTDYLWKFFWDIKYIKIRSILEIFSMVVDDWKQNKLIREIYWVSFLARIRRECSAEYAAYRSPSCQLPFSKVM